MSARDRWSQDFRCPHCGKGGTVYWSEDDGYIHGDPHRHVDAISDGFEVRQMGASTTTQEVFCQSCGEQIPT